MGHLVVRAVVCAGGVHDALEVRAGDDGVAEEAARTAQFLHGRKFFSPDADDGSADKSGAKHGFANRLQGLTHAAIVQTRLGGAAEAVGDGGDDIAAFPLGLELGGTVGRRQCSARRWPLPRRE